MLTENKCLSETFVYGCMFFTCVWKLKVFIDHMNIM